MLTPSICFHVEVSKSPVLSSKPSSPSILWNKLSSYNSIVSLTPHLQLSTGNLMIDPSLNVIYPVHSWINPNSSFLKWDFVTEIVFLLNHSHPITCHLPNLLVCYLLFLSVLDKIFSVFSSVLELVHNSFTYQICFHSMGFIRLNNH